MSRARHTLRRVGRQEGLPNTQVQDVTEDASGLIWVATPGGLARFDGVRVRAYGPEAGLQTHGLRAVAAASDGAVWIGSDLGLEHRKPTGEIKNVRGDWRFGFVECITIDRVGTVWVGTARGLVRVGADKRAEPIDDPRVSGRLVDDVGVDALGRVVVLIDGVVWRQDAETWLEVSGGLGRNTRATSFCTHPDGIMVCGAGVLIDVDHTANPIDRFTIEGPPVTAAMREGSMLWVAQGTDLLRFARVGDDGWAQTECVCSGVSVNRLIRDRAGNIWAATNSGGLLVFSVLAPAVQPVALRGGAVLSIRIEHGQTLVGSDDSASTRTPAGLVHDAGLEGTRVWDYRVDAAGVRWAATQHGLQRAIDDSWETVLPDRPEASAPGRCLLARGDRLWAGSIVGLTILERASGKAVADLQGSEQLGYVYSLFEGSDQTVWVGTIGNGLWCLRLGATLERAGEDGVGSNVYGLATAPDGRLFVGTNNEILVRSPEGDWRVLATSRDSVLAWSLLWHEGRLWAGTGRGLVELDPDTGTVRRIVSLFFDESAWEFTTSRALRATAQGSLLCGTSGGLIEVFPNELQTGHRPVAMLTDSRWNGVQPTQAGRSFLLDTGKWTAEFDLGAGWFASDDLQFRFRLLGFSNDWQEARNATVQFSSLPPGDYELQAVASTGLTGDGPMQKLLSIQVRAPWWAPSWLAAPARGVSSLLEGLTGRSRNIALLRENKELEERVRARTADLDRTNAELAAMNAELQRSSVTDPLTSAYNRRWFDSELPRIVERGRREARAVSVLLIDVDWFKSYNDTYGHLEGDRCLQDVVRAVDDATRNATDGVVRYGGEEFAVILSSATQEVAARVAERIRQAIWNTSIKHATEYGRVTISLGGATLGPTDKAPVADASASLVARADEALYAAKRAGRNRVQWDTAPRKPT